MSIEAPKTWLKYAACGRVVCIPFRPWKGCCLSACLPHLLYLPIRSTADCPNSCKATFRCNDSLVPVDASLCQGLYRKKFPSNKWPKFKHTHTHSNVQCSCPDNYLYNQDVQKVKVPVIVLYYILKTVPCKVITETEFAACNSCSSYCSVEGSWHSVTELL